MARSRKSPLAPVITGIIIAACAVAPTSSGSARAQDGESTDLDELIAQLGHAEPTVRAEAAESLGRLGPKAKAAVPALQRVLRDRFAYVRESASNALIKIGPAGISELIAALGDSTDDDARLRALHTLRELGPGARSAVPALVRLLADPTFKWRLAVDEVLVSIGEPSVAPLVEMLKSEDAFAREVAAGTLRELGSPAARALTDLIGDADAGVRRRAVRLLGDMGERAGASVPKLVDTLTHDDWILAARAREALVRIGKPSVSLLVEGLKDRDKTKRRAIADTLAAIGKTAGEDASKPLLRLLQDGDAHVRIAAAHAVWRIAGDAGSAIGVLSDGVKSDEEDVHGHAAEVLGAMGPDAAGAVRALNDQLKAGNLERRETVCWILWRIGPEARDALPTLLEAVASDERSLREVAALALSTVGIRQKKAADALNERLGDEVPRVRVAAALALGQVSNDRSGPVQVLIAALTGDDDAIRGGAAQALIQLGDASVEPLADLMKTADEQTRRTAAFILVRIGAPSVSALTKMLEKSKDAALRRIGAEALGSIGPDAKGATAALQQASQRDADAGVRSAAKSALGRIEG